VLDRRKRKIRASSKLQSPTITNECILLTYLSVYKVCITHIDDFMINNNHLLNIYKLFKSLICFVTSNCSRILNFFIFFNLLVKPIIHIPLQIIIKLIRMLIMKILSFYYNEKSTRIVALVT